MGLHGNLVWPKPIPHAGILLLFHWKVSRLLIDPQKPQNFSTLNDFQYMVCFDVHILSTAIASV